MSKSQDGAASLGELSNQIYTLLAPLTEAERAKVLRATKALFGDEMDSELESVSPKSDRPAGQMTTPTGEGAQEFFAVKTPKSKVEMLAVAARYREVNKFGDTHSVEELAKIFGEARQNFDRHNFPSDIANAQNLSKLFNKGTPRGQYQLSYYGQQFVDALPSRDAIKAIRKPSGAAPKKPAKKAGAK